MELFRNTRLKIGERILAKKVANTKRKVYYSDIAGVRRIGVVWDATNTSDFVHLSGFHQKMQKRNIESRIFGYFPNKDLPDTYTAISYLTCIRKNDINLFYLPVTNDAYSFINDKFDILIDINFRNLLTLKYISSLSRASFKVGLFESDKNESPFDLLMDINNPVNIEDYLDQVMKYLEMIDAGKNNT
jgi:hypothetical protein